MTACLVVWHCSENQQLSVPSLWRRVFTEMTYTLLCQSHQLYYWFRASSAAGMKDYAGFTDRFEFIFSLLCQVFLLRTESGPRPAAGRSLSVSLSPFQTKPVPFTIEPENSHQCSGFVCAQFNTHRNTTCCTELVFTVCHWQNVSQWMELQRTSPLCVIIVAVLLPSVLRTISLQGAWKHNISPMCLLQI